MQLEGNEGCAYQKSCQKAVTNSFLRPPILRLLDATAKPSYFKLKKYMGWGKKESYK